LLFFPFSVFSLVTPPPGPASVLAAESAMSDGGGGGRSGVLKRSFAAVRGMPTIPCPLYHKALSLRTCFICRFYS
jgi:hypothetical protein